MPKLFVKLQLEWGKTVLTLRQSGAIYEITEAVHEAAFAACDTTKDLRESGVIKK